MSTRTLQCHIVSPEGPLFDGAVDSVVVTSEKGELAIYPGHAPLVSTLDIGELRIAEKDGKRYFAANKGFLEISGNEVNVLVTLVAKPEDSSGEELEEEGLKVAAMKATDDESYIQKLEARQWLQIRKKVKSKGL